MEAPASELAIAVLLENCARAVRALVSGPMREIADLKRDILWPMEQE